MQLTSRRPPFPRVIDSSLRASFVACPQKCHLEYFYNIHPVGPSIHLFAGGCWAKALDATRQAFYSDGASEAKAISAGIGALEAAWSRQDMSGLDPNHVKHLDNLRVALLHYFVEYPLATDKFKPLLVDGRAATEHNFLEPLNVPHPETGEPLLYSGRYDMLADRDGVLFILDDKTTTQLGQSWSNQWDLRAQLTGYVWGARRYNQAVAGAIIRGMSFLKTGFGHAEVIVYRPDWMINRWMMQLERDIGRMVQCWRDGWWDYNLDNSCTAYGGCANQRLCGAEEPLRWLVPYYQRRVWDPVTATETFLPIEELLTHDTDEAA